MSEWAQEEHGDACEQPVLFRFAWFTLQWPATFRALRHRNFQLFWFGQLISLIGTWMQSAAQGWLVFTLALNEFGPHNTALIVSMVGAAGSLPMFFLTLFAGVLADRMDKRRILVLTQSASMVLAFALAVLISLKIVLLWQVALFSVLSGVVMSFDMPTRQSYVREMVGPDDLLNAIALNSSIFNAARIIGPFLGGLLMAVPWIGVAGVFYLNGISFIAVIAGLLMIRATPLIGLTGEGNVWQHLIEGFQYVLGHSTIRTLMVIMTVYSIFGFAYTGLLSVIAGQVLNVGNWGYGIMLSATGVGALIGALLLASLAGRVLKGGVMMLSGVAFSIGLIVFGFSHSLLLASIALAVVGGGLVIGSSSINSIIQEIVPDSLRGRVVSMWTFIFAGFTPIGLLYAGVLAHYTSASLAIVVSGVICLLFLAMVAVFAPWVQRLE